MAPVRGRSNALVAAGVVAGIGFMFSVPLLVKNNTGQLSFKEGPLTGSQIQRGVYLNTGTKDLGVDPDWDPVNRVWKGKRNRVDANYNQKSSPEEENK